MVSDCRLYICSNVIPLPYIDSFSTENASLVHISITKRLHIHSFTASAAILKLNANLCGKGGRQTDLRYQYGISGGESQTPFFVFRTLVAGANERRLYSQAKS